MSKNDQLAVYNPNAHGNHIATNVTKAKFQKLVLADPNAPRVKDVRRADRILTAAGLNTAGFSNTKKILLARILVSDDQLARTIAAMPNQTLAGEISKLALNGDAQCRTLAASMTTLGNQSLASHIATLALECPAAATQLNAMVLGGGQFDIQTPATLSGHVTTLAPLATTDTARRALLEVFRGAQGLKAKDAVWDVNLATAAGVNLDAARDALNGVQKEVLLAHVGRPGVGGPNVALGANRLIAAKALTAVETNRFLEKLGQKLDNADAHETRLEAETLAHNDSSLLKIWAETATPGAIAAHITGLTATEKVELLGKLTEPNAAYKGLREGTDRLLNALNGQLPAPLADAVRHVLSGFWDGAQLSADIAANHPHDAAGFTQIANNANTQADHGVTAMQTTINQRQTDLGNHIGAIMTQHGNGVLTQAAVENILGMPFAQVQQLHAALGNPATKAQVEDFAKLFGSALTLPSVNLPPNVTTPLSGAQQSNLRKFAQVMMQIDALRANPGHYLTGLEHIAMTLPTAGKRLEDLTFVPTMVRELQATLASAGQPGRLTDFPILVFDQSADVNLFNANAQYLNNLALQTGARIEHISMATIKQFETQMGIQGMFDTTGSNKAGYAGARNIANLLGPLLQRELQNHPNTTVADVLNTNTGAQLKLLLQNSALNNHSMVLMGDDDASVMPGFLHSKALIAQQNQGEYITSKTVVDGRGTTSGLPVNNPTAFLLGDGAFLRSTVFGSTNWSTTDIKPVMAGALGSPGACLNLPVPTEESHFAAYRGVEDILSRATHHATDRYEDFPGRLKGFVSYSSQGSLADSLLECGQHYQTSPVLPWNSRSQVLPFADLSDIFNYGAQAPERRGMQKAYFANLLTMESTKAPLQELNNTDYDTVMNNFLTQQHDNLNPTQRREFQEVREGYKAVQADFHLGIRFRDNLVQQLMQDFNNLPLPHDLAWNTISADLANNVPAAKQQAIDYLVDRDHHFSGSVDAVKLALGAPPNDPSANDKPLAQIVFLTAKAIGGGEFNQHMYNMTH